MGELKLPRHVLITGASGGIGAALARAYARGGVRLSLCARNPDRLEAVAGDCRARGARVEAKVLDVTDIARLQQWVAQCDADEAIDLVIANAGRTLNVGPNGEEESWDDTRDLLAINVDSALATVIPLVGPMRRRGHGQIALVSSLAGYRGMAITPAYCASKAAVKAYGEALRGLVAADGVGVSVICPGFVESEMSRRFPGSKPFLVSSDQAAAIIQRGLARNRARISFPFPLNFGTWMLTLLPAGCADFILQRLSYGRSR
ncbi:capsular polysaccharide biosynthesis dehydrogenase/reductase [Marinobacterium nitratireducens]|uniref:Capsular polysaccharide biosynthesis dehydrogenase/reductase n=1 Tax=Marinobacterium nitratireducens TaxID=518897 RepID=A0A918DR21_9GAMM|nr:SDR family NAD(P)-dependent oxidoreductase [Marinobacterium nitratireducens]GGO79483.1 capsular polysaccharide biosynthesis dehydrogenase/reductase [Marinobacterium nitratireducens]